MRATSITQAVLQSCEDNLGRSLGGGLFYLPGKHGKFRRAFEFFSVLFSYFLATFASFGSTPKVTFSLLFCFLGVLDSMGPFALHNPVIVVVKP